MSTTRVDERFLLYLDGGPHHAEDLGGKALGINSLLADHYPVPMAAVLTTTAYRHFVSDPTLDLLIRDLRTSSMPSPERIAAEGAAIERAFLSAALPAPIEAALTRLEHDLLGRGPVAVRSSATAEDLAEASFAGQYTTFLGVTNPDELREAVRRCWASLWMPAARAYRRRHRIPERHLAMAVVVQEMVDPLWSGVAFTTDPQSEGHLMRVEATPGLGEDLVSGRVTPSDFLVRRETLEVMPATGSPSLEFVEDLARLALRLEDHAQQPLDIEWAFTSDGLTLLQVRPITEPVDPTGHDDGLDTANAPPHTFTPHGVVEMVPGVIAPLLWTINAPMLENAFRTTFADLGGDLPAKSEPIVARFRGRAALDLTSICRVAGSLPGGDPSEVERQYLGEVVEQEPVARTGAHLFAAMRSRRVHNRIIDEVDLAANAAGGLARMQVVLAGMPVRRLVAYRQRIRDLAWRAYAAEVGASSAAGATYRALELLLERWLPADEAASWAQLLTKGALDESPVGGARTKGLDLVLANYGTVAVVAAIQGDAPNKRELLGVTGEGRRFLEALDTEVRAMGSKAIYGDETWAEDEAWIWRQLQLLSGTRRPRTKVVPWTEDFSTLCRHLREQKRWRRMRILTGQVIDLRIRWLRRQVEETIRFLELRERAKNALLVLGGEERRIIVEAGSRLLASRQLSDADEVRYLTDAELEGMLFGACGIEPDELARRRAVGRACEAAGPIPDRFTGDPDQAPRPHVPEDSRLSGWAASPGLYEGPARVITSLSDGVRLQPGDVLVAHSTDPSWTPLFLVAGAVALEVGGPLSHAAIVAREFGLPAVLNVRGIAQLLADGDMVTVDGTAGVVELEREGAT